MTDRVLTSGEAKDAIDKFKQILDGGLTDQIDALDREGATLSKQEVWDGRLAAQFRSEWPQTHQALVKVCTELNELHTQIQQIHQNIMQAGGNQ
jgi:WXG100 family type VII secretion target